MGLLARVGKNRGRGGPTGTGSPRFARGGDGDGDGTRHGDGYGDGDFRKFRVGTGRATGMPFFEKC